MKWIYRGKETSGAMESPGRMTDRKGEATERPVERRIEMEKRRKSGQNDGWKGEATERMVRTTDRDGEATDNPGRTTDRKEGDGKSGQNDG
ncbi:hypothetical protein ACZ11_11440 [Lysinibacillus xylanilyticus]|uniref:Uncharacterized protein n=1 Tax=Lysinibacillus xylanilyticus TaxID=582475 RepID=A0A0K9FEX8_9BACI|nr:hypothetical protein ACZ11_11440 [Lysinibacillus xylanilyticus]